MKVFIAAGHGAADPGAVVNGTNEATEVIHIVDNCVDILQKVADSTHEIIKIDDKLNLADEVAVINRESKTPDVDIAIEVHMNSNSGLPGTGIEVYYGNKTLAQQLFQVLVPKTGLLARAVKEGNYLYFNNTTTPPSALVELGFINNPDDLRIVREKGALALAQAIATVCGLQDPAVLQPPSQPPSVRNRIVDILQKIIDFVTGLKTAESGVNPA